MKKEKKQLTFIFILMIILVAGVVIAEEEMATKYDPMSGKALTEAEAKSNPNAQPLPDGFNGKVEPGMNYDAEKNQICDKAGGFCADQGCSFCQKFIMGSNTCNAGGGNEVEGSGKATMTPQMDQAIQAVVGLVQSIASIMAPIKDVLTNAKGETTANSGASSLDLGLNSGAQAGLANQQSVVDAAANGACDYQTKEVCENVTTKVCEDAVGTNQTTNSSSCTQKRSEECRTQQVCVLKKDGAAPGQTVGSVLSGNAVAGSEEDSDRGMVGIVLSQNNERAKADTSIREMGTLLASSVNLKVEVKKQMNVYTPDQKKTDITLKGASGEPAQYIEGSNTGSSGSSPVTGKVIEPMDNGQFVKLVKHDLGLGGEQISVETLKSLNEVDANGADLNLKDGDTLIEFNKQKTYYSREIKDTPYFMNKITNQNDGENYFRLLQGGSNGNYLADDSKRATVGDAIVNHPSADMKGIVIAKEREEMFKKGLVVKR